MKTYTNTMRNALMTTLKNYQTSINDLQKPKSKSAQWRDVLRRWDSYGEFTACGMCAASNESVHAPNCDVCPLSTMNDDRGMPCAEETYSVMRDVIEDEYTTKAGLLEALIGRFLWLIEQGVRTGIL